MRHALASRATEIISHSHENPRRCKPGRIFLSWRFMEGRKDMLKWVTFKICHKLPAGKVELFHGYGPHLDLVVLLGGIRRTRPCPGIFSPAMIHAFWPARRQGLRKPRGRCVSVWLSGTLRREHSLRRIVMEVLYRCLDCRGEFRLDEDEPCYCPRCGSGRARLIQRFY